MPKKDVLQPVDNDARQAAKTLVRTARYGALGTLDPGTGTPMTSRVSLATSADGTPVFLISQLSGHFGALEADPRASILLGEPGTGDPLAYPRITLFGRAVQVADGLREAVRARFLSRQPKAGLYVDFADFAFWRLEIDGASFNGGFGKAYAMAAEDLLSPTDPDLERMEAGAVSHMNEDHLDALALYATGLVGRGAGAWRLACIDLEGLDLVAGDEVARLWFDPALECAADLRPRLVDLAKRARSLHA